MAQVRARQQEPHVRTFGGDHSECAEQCSVILLWVRTSYVANDSRRSRKAQGFADARAVRRFGRNKPRQIQTVGYQIEWPAITESAVNLDSARTARDRALRKPTRQASVQLCDEQRELAVPFLGEVTVMKPPTYSASCQSRSQPTEKVGVIHPRLHN